MQAVDRRRPVQRRPRRLTNPARALKATRQRCRTNACRRRQTTRRSQPPWACVGDSADETRHRLARPRPVAERSNGALIDVDHDDARSVGGRAPRRLAAANRRPAPRSNPRSRRTLDHSAGATHCAAEGPGRPACRRTRPDDCDRSVKHSLNARSHQALPDRRRCDRWSG